MCSKKSWTRSYMPISSIAQFFMQCYTETKCGVPQKRKKQWFGYDTEGYRKLHVDMIVWGTFETR